MKAKIQILVGSQAFFRGMPGFTPKDMDILCVAENYPASRVKGNVIVFTRFEKEFFFVREMGKDLDIEDTLNVGVPMRAGKFLVPEFAEYIGLTLDDLRKLESLYYSMDDKHKYEKVIYDSYVKNGGFFLTEEQREKAYKVYRKYRVK